MPNTNASLLTGLKSWQFNLLVVVASVALSATVVMLIEMALLGHLRPTTLQVSAISALIIAGIVVSVTSKLRKHIGSTQRLALEKSFADAQDQLGLAVETAQMVFWNLDLVTGKFRFHHQSLNWLGFPEGTKLRTVADWLTLMHPDDQGPFMHQFQAALLPGAADFSFDYRMQQVTNSWGWVHSQGRVKECDAQGNPTLAVGGTINITQRKIAELALTESEALLKATLSATDEGILMVGEGGQVLSFNQRFIELWRVPEALAQFGRDNLLLAHVLAQLNEPDAFAKEVSRLYDSDDELRDTVHFKDGRVFSRFTRGLSASTYRGRIWCFKDITEQTRTHEALAQSLGLFKAVIDNAPVRIFWKDLNLRYLGCNPSFARDSNLEVADVIGKTDFELIWRDHAQAYVADDRALMASGQARLAFDEPQTNPDGSMIWERVSKVPLRAQDNTLIGVLGMYEDVTERKKAEQALHDSEEKLRAIFDNVDACIYLKDTEGRYLFANQATCTLWNTDLAQVIGRSDADFFWEQSVQNIRGNDRLVLETGEKIHCEETNQVRSTGRQVNYLSTKLPLRHADGSIFALCGISTDITVIKQLNAELQERSLFQTALLEAIPIPIFYKDAKGRYLGFNEAYEKLIGLSRSELIGKGVSEDAPKPLADICHAQDEAMLAQRGVQRYESQVQDTKGVLHDVIFSKACFMDTSGRVGGLIGGILDVTALKQSERAHKESEQRAKELHTLLRRVADNVPDMIWAKDTNKRYLFANKAICEQLLMATDTQEPLGHDDLYFALRERARHADNPQWHTFGELCQDSDAITLQRGTACQFDEFGNVRGQLLYLDVLKAPLKDENGETIGVVGSARDITAQREAREKLKLLALVLTRSSEAMFMTDADNRIVDINPAFTRMTGYALAEVEGHAPSILSSGKHSTDFYQSMWSAIKSDSQWQGEIWNRRKNGELFAVWLTITTLYNDDGKVHRRVALFSDITDKKRCDGQPDGK